jgi:linoleate 10R-lipoxygenase
MTNEKKPVPWGVGNQVSAEFNLVYRWHSAISKKDEEWTEQLYLDLFQKPSSEMTMESLLEGLKEMGRTINPDPQKRPFAKLTRDENGRYDDDKLVEIMVSSIEDCAGKAFEHRHEKIRWDS